MAKHHHESGPHRPHSWGRVSTLVATGAATLLATGALWWTLLPVLGQGHGHTPWSADGVTTLTSEPGDATVGGEPPRTEAPTSSVRPFQPTRSQSTRATQRTQSTPRLSASSAVPSMERSRYGPAPDTSLVRGTGRPTSSPQASRRPVNSVTTTTQPQPPPTRTTAVDGVKFRREFVTALNSRRSALGLPAVTFSQELSDAAAECSAKSLELGRLEHCGHEVLWMGGAGGIVEKVLDAWFNSQGHLTALTYGSSRNAGGAFVVRGNTAVAAITIDY